jgi:amyloid beta precursor protein binding protein 1
MKNTTEIFKELFDCDTLCVSMLPCFYFRTLIPLSKKLWDLEIPLIVCRSYGFIGYIRVQVTEHTVIETHPDNQIPDLRLDKPFPSLKKYVDSIDLEAMEYKDHAHVPYLIVLYKCLQQWKVEHSGQLPNSYKEKELFKSTIRKGMFTNPQLCVACRH